MNMDVAQALINLGALGVIVYLFVAGKLVSQETVNKLMEAQANHMSDLKAEVVNMRTAINSRLDEMVTILGDIRDGGSMGGKKKK